MPQHQHAPQDTEGFSGALIKKDAAMYCNEEHAAAEDDGTSLMRKGSPLPEPGPRTNRKQKRHPQGMLSRMA